MPVFLWGLAMHIDEVIRRSQPVALEEMLAARDERAERQRGLLSRFPGLALVSFTLNIPGRYKAYSLAERAFVLGMGLIERQLERAGVAVAHREEKRAATGYEFLLAAEAPAEAVKRITVAIEESHPLGRLFDIDVLGCDGIPLRGDGLGRGERTCLVCGGPVWECARNRAHPAEQLARKVGELLRDFLDGEFASRMAALATRALLYEVNATPKPGLVDRRNNGSHRDMDIFTFIDSSVTLTPFFRDMVRMGLGYDGPVAGLLPRLRFPGQWAEDAMFVATTGVNTHKGLIFSLGLLCAAAGLARAGGLALTPEVLLPLCGEIAAATPEELRRMEAAAETHGEGVFRKFGLTGARGEAARGYPDVREYGYPVLKRMREKGCGWNDAGVAALLHLLAHVQDTNIVARSDLNMLRKVQSQVADMLARDGDDVEKLLADAAELDAQFMAAGISAGGCADLLALSYMLCFLESVAP